LEKGKGPVRSKGDEKKGRSFYILATRKGGEGSEGRLGSWQKRHFRPSGKRGELLTLTKRKGKKKKEMGTEGINQQQRMSIHRRDRRQEKKRESLFFHRKNA